MTRAAVGDKWLYASDVRGTITKASKVLYTHASIFAPMDGSPTGPILFHKTHAAAMKERGYPQYGWVKQAVVEIGEAA